MKKVLSLVLAVVMMMSLLAVTASARHPGQRCGRLDGSGFLLLQISTQRLFFFQAPPVPPQPALLLIIGHGLPPLAVKTKF